MRSLPPNLPPYDRAVGRQLGFGCEGDGSGRRASLALGREGEEPAHEALDVVPDRGLYALVSVALHSGSCIPAAGRSETTPALGSAPPATVYLVSVEHPVPEEIFELFSGAAMDPIAAWPDSARAALAF